jgi:pyridoxal phosphate enzyme (YggS family)
VLVAVSKKFPPEAIEAAYEAGVREFGENYVQEFEGKAPALHHLHEARFHFIGHLQSNKAAKAAALFQVIQTVDTPKLAERLDRLTDRELGVMVEVKLGNEDAKAGVNPEALPTLLESLRTLSRVELLGLMTMPPWSEDPEASRPYFARLRELGAKVGVHGLSMGMSNDLEVGIEEGATHVRVGTALFGPRTR